MQQEIENPMTCRACGGLVRALTEDEEGQSNLIPLHNRGKCIACKKAHTIHRRKNGEIISLTMM